MSPNWLARPLPHTRGSYDKSYASIAAPPLAIVEFVALPPPVAAKLEDAFEKNCKMCGGVLVRDKRGSVGLAFGSEWEVVEEQVLIDPTELSPELTARLFGENMPTIGKIAFDVREFFSPIPSSPTKAAVDLHSGGLKVVSPTHSSCSERQVTLPLPPQFPPPSATRSTAQSSPAS